MPTEFKYLFPFLISILFTNCQTTEHSIQVIKDGKSYYSIVADSSSSDGKLAATELQHYLEISTGAKLPIYYNKPRVDGPLIYVKSNYAVKEDCIFYNYQKNDIYIGGNSDKNTLYAVYDFLEKYADCHWLSPTVEIIPSKKEIKIPVDLNYKYTLPITTRTVHSKLFYENHHYADKLHVTYEAFPGYVPEGRVHTFHRLVPEKKFFKSHPEYFALRNGKRIPTQLCLTHPDVYKIIKKGAGDWFEKYPEKNIISVSQDDNQQYCQCDNCEKINKREESPAGSIIELVNKLAADFPNKIISTLAYQYSRKAPKNLKPAKNVLITLCSIECDRSGSIENKCEPFASDLKEWGKLTDNIRIWDYTTQFTNFLAPFPNLHTLQPNLKLFINNNTRWVFEQHSHNNSELFELRSWLLAKLLWNPNSDTDSLIHVFCENYYEAATPFVEEYISTVHDELKKDSSFFLFLYGDPSQGFNSFLNTELLEKYDSLFNQAESAVANKTNILQRIKSARLGVDLAILEACRKGLSEKYALQIKNNDGGLILNKNVEKRLNNFIANCRADSIEYMNENRFTLNDYEALYRATINRASSPNIAAGKKVTLLTQPKKYADENPKALTDGAFGGNSFYANWLGFEGNDGEAIIDLGESKIISHISTAFLQYVNHIVFLPKSVSYYISENGEDFKLIKKIKNPKPLNPKSKINFIEPFNAHFPKIKTRYVKIVADNMDRAPIWHHGAGLPAWIFLDEVTVH